MKLSLYSGNLSTYYKSITLVEGKNSCMSLIMNGLYPVVPIGPKTAKVQVSLSFIVLGV